jgi:hypothetical protein
MLSTQSTDFWRKWKASMPNVVPEIAETDSHSGREARLTRDGEGAPIGAAIWLNADELSSLGVDIETVDSVSYRICGDDLNIGGSGISN